MGYNIDITLNTPISLTTEKLEELKFKIGKEKDFKNWKGEMIHLLQKKEITDVSYHLLNFFIEALKKFEVKELFIFECLGEDGCHYRILYKDGKQITQKPELIYPPIPEDMQ